ncbi:MAG: hypothetical protein ACLQG5_04040, partial [Methanobacterium sp.]
MTEQTQEDFRKHLEEQIGFLLRSAESYDEGYKSEAKRMAVVMCVLLHDRGDNTVSLLTHLNKKDMLFYDTAPDLDPRDILAKSTLAHMFMTFGNGEGNCEYLPNLNENPVTKKNVKVSFEDWWDKEVIKDMSGTTFTRNELVTKVCNQDGGAHIDAKLNKKYADLTRNNSMKITYQINDKGGPIPDVELASVRQISYEVLKSLKDEFPTFF